MIIYEILFITIYSQYSTLCTRQLEAGVSSTFKYSLFIKQKRHVGKEVVHHVLLNPQVCLVQLREKLGYSCGLRLKP